MGQQFVLARQAREVVADHLVGPQRRFTPGPQADQHASDDRAVGLNLDPLLTVAEQVPTTQHVLEEPEKRFNRPAVQKNQGDHFGGHVEQIGRDPQDAIAVEAGRAASILAAASMGADANDDQAKRMVGPRLRLARESHLHDLIAKHIQRAIGVGERTFFQHLVGAVVAQAAHVAAARLDDLIEQQELGVAAVHHVGAIRFDRAAPARLAFVVGSAAARA